MEEQNGDQLSSDPFKTKLILDTLQDYLQNNSTNVLNSPMNTTKTQTPLNSPSPEDIPLPLLDKALAEYEALKSEAIEAFLHQELKKESANSQRQQ